MSGVFYGFLIHYKLDVCVWDITSCLPEYLLSEPNMPLGEMENRVSSMWKLLMAGQGLQSNASLISDVHREYVDVLTG